VQNYLLHTQYFKTRSDSYEQAQKPEDTRMAWQGYKQFGGSHDISDIHQTNFGIVV
jgi:hypothetical protein